MYPSGSIPSLRATNIIAEITRGERGMTLACCDDMPRNSNAERLSGYKVLPRCRIPDWYKLWLSLIPSLAPRRLRSTYAQLRCITNAGVYVCLLAAYRGLYVLNWMWRYHTERFFQPLAYLSAIVQAALYLMFVVDRVARYVPKRVGAASNPMCS